jgi:polyhydroxybutyrate depolymerase
MRVQARLIRVVAERCHKVCPGSGWHAVVVLLCMLAACASASARASVERSIDIGGRSRTYLVYRPASLGYEKPVPLIVVLHGGFGSGAQAEKSYNWDAEADTEGFVVVYPNGVRRSWNAGGPCCGTALRDGVDDVGFLSGAIAAVSRAENIDASRVYLTGISNGAAMAYRYACEGSVPVAAFGSVSGDMTEPCRHSRAVSLMEIHGLDDHNIPFAGGQGSKGVTHINWPPVMQTLDLFRRAGACAAPVTSTRGAVATVASVCTGGREVILMTIAGAGHQWPGGRPPGRLVGALLGLDPPSTALDATRTLWDFFKRHEAPR